MTQLYVYNNDVLNGLYTTQREGSVWIYDLLHKYGYKVLFFEGDSDGSISLTGSWQWIKRRNYTVVKGWSPLFTEEGQLFGFSKGYDLFQLVTIHGEGHPAYFVKGKEVTSILANFLNDLPLQ